LNKAVIALQTAHGGVHGMVCGNQALCKVIHNRNTDLTLPSQLGHLDEKRIFWI
jgi:hypothetical protein